MHVELRTAGDPAAFWPEVRRAVAEYAPGLPLLRPITQQAEFDNTISGERLVARLAICFGIVAIVLVATGLYGTLAYRVRRRTSELGVRMAMGAQRRDLLWMVVRESLAIAAVGAAAGLPLAYMASTALKSILYGLAPDDVLTFCLGVAGVGLVSVAASVTPAIRAASVDPVIALRYE
jgi:ABC-type antimicrobial peptide transport system permease subunit